MGRIDKHGQEHTDSDRSELLARWSKDFRLPLLRFFQRRAPATFDPDDLVQEVFVRLARRKDLSDIERIEGYLFQTASNVLTDRYRKHQRGPDVVESFDELLHGKAELTPEHVLMDREALKLMIQCLYDLPERTRDIFVLYHFENQRQIDIAQRFSMPISTVEKHMARANKYLLKRLERNR